MRRILHPAPTKPWAGYVLAMAHWRSGDKAEARRCYDAAVERMGKEAVPAEHAVRFRAEAAEMLGVKEAQ